MARDGLSRWVAVVSVVVVLLAAGCSSGGGGTDDERGRGDQGSSQAGSSKVAGTVVTLSTGDRFSVVLPDGWEVLDSDGEHVILFGGAEGSLAVGELLFPCGTAAQCAESETRSGGVSEDVDVNGVTFYWCHDKPGYERLHTWYLEWNGRTYQVDTAAAPEGADPGRRAEVVSSITWLD